MCGTLNGRRLADGTLLYGCTCNLSITLAAINRLQFDTGFPDAAFEVRAAAHLAVAHLVVVRSEDMLRCVCLHAVVCQDAGKTFALASPDASKHPVLL